MKKLSILLVSTKPSLLSVPPSLAISSPSTSLSGTKWGGGRLCGTSYTQQRQWRGNNCETTTDDGGWWEPGQPMAVGGGEIWKWEGETKNRDLGCVWRSQKTGCWFSWVIKNVNETHDTCLVRVRGFVDPKLESRHLNQTNSNLVGLVRIGPDLSKNLEKKKKKTWLGRFRAVRVHGLPKLMNTPIHKLFSAFFNKVSKTKIYSLWK